jgi:hypothetical protein
VTLRARWVTAVQVRSTARATPTPTPPPPPPCPPLRRPGGTPAPAAPPPAATRSAPLPGGWSATRPPLLLLFSPPAVPLRRRPRRRRCRRRRRARAPSDRRTNLTPHASCRDHCRRRRRRRRCPPPSNTSLHIPVYWRDPPKPGVQAQPTSLHRRWRLRSDWPTTCLLVYHASGPLKTVNRLERKRGVWGYMVQADILLEMWCFAFCRSRVAFPTCTDVTQLQPFYQH